jgi:hypothetical protein
VQDPWNPTEAEVRDWAYRPGAVEPEQDWELALSGTGFEALYVDLAADPACPARDFFLRVLYLLVGDAARTRYRSLPAGTVEALLERGLTAGRPELALWAERSRELMRHPETFGYDAWCGGGLARTPRG